MKLAHIFISIVLVAIGIVAMAGIRGHHFAQPPFELFPDMNYQDKVKDQVSSTFFADGNAARPPVPGTIAEEMPAHNDYWATGKWDEAHWGDGIPVHPATANAPALQVDAANMNRGRDRYNISCSACHGASGDGKGITSKYGLNAAANYHDARLIQASDGDIFNTMTNGKGQMIGLGYNISIDDRWRIIMYIRALQRSQNATLDDATPEQQQQLQQKVKKPAAPAQTQAASAIQLLKVTTLDKNTVTVPHDHVLALSQ
jgi:mono/diheme cytochrome c family protein